MILEEQGRLLLRCDDDLLGLFTRLGEHAVALLIDTSRLTDLFGDGDAQLIDHVEDGGLFEDDLTRHRDLARVHDERFKAFHEELNVQGHPPPPPPSYRRNKSVSSPISLTRSKRARSGSFGWCFVMTRATTDASGATASMSRAWPSVVSSTATSANGGSQKTRSNGPATPSRKARTLAADT